MVCRVISKSFQKQPEKLFWVILARVSMLLPQWEISSIMHTYTSSDVSDKVSKEPTNFTTKIQSSMPEGVNARICKQGKKINRKEVTLKFKLTWVPRDCAQTAKPFEPLLRFLPASTPPRLDDLHLHDIYRAFNSLTFRGSQHGPLGTNREWPQDIHSSRFVAPGDGDQSDTRKGIHLMRVRQRTTQMYWPTSARISASPQV